MSEPHRIRLQGPWLINRLGQLEERIKLPQDWEPLVLSNKSSEIFLSRYFNRPTGIDSCERIFLVVEPNDSISSITLNEKALVVSQTESKIFRTDITSLLNIRNQLQLKLSDSLNPYCPNISIEID